MHSRFCMKGLIDIHCHILPDLDDGAKNMDEALKMLKMSYESGVSTIVATPHFHIGRVVAEYEKCNSVLEKLKLAIEREKLDIEVLLGSEIYYTNDILKKVSNNEIHTLAASKYILLEFSPWDEYGKLLQAVNETYSSGYIPVFAHIERYACLHDNMKRVDELYERGALLQVNARSVTGDNGRKNQRFIKKLMKNRAISFIASDGHDSINRVTSLNKCFQYVSKKYGGDTAEKIFCENPRYIIENRQSPR